MKKYVQGITKLKSFMKKKQKNWKGINYPLEKDDWKKSEKNNLKIALKRKKKKILSIIENIIQIIKNKLFF